jgi:hypothetical protein
MTDGREWDSQFIDDYKLEDRRDRRRGRDANLAGKPFDLRQNLDWQRGWQDAEDDRRLDT